MVLNGDIAIDTEAMGLNNMRDRLCVIQISDGSGSAHVVHFPTKDYAAPNLRKYLTDKNRVKIFHFARFDLSIIHHYMGIKMENVYCTKIASRLSRTFTDQHGLKDLSNDLIQVKLNKQQQTSDWGSNELSRDQVEYAAADVLYLHRIRERLNFMLVRENRMHIAQDCFNFLPSRAELDILGWPELDIFAH